MINMQEKIKYHEIMALGFKEEICNDNVYFKEHGFKYAIITLTLRTHIYLEWDKATQLTEMIRVNRDDKILKRMPIKNLDHLKEMIDFFSDKPVSQDYNAYTTAC